MADYDFNSVTIANSTPGFVILSLQSRRGRVSVAVSVPQQAIANTLLEIRIGTGGRIPLWGSVLPFSQLFAYRDWGPLISEEWWIRGNVNILSWSVTEVWRIPNT
jgi:hypothetical protein